MLGEDVLMPRERFQLLGEHNVQNALAACLVAEIAGVARPDLVNGVATFKALPHRLEPVREVDGRTWINDSKATNVASTRAALRAMEKPYVLILGGRHKDEPFEELGAFLAPHCRKVIAYGEAGEILEKALRSFVEVCVVHTLEDGVMMARDSSLAGDVVLMSPACTSFDQFRNFEVRGDAFRQLVEAL
jgi:UDP-N-acetylmuramoylalanine--D-glutamate ligase